MIWTVFLIPVVTIVCVFTFVSVATWSENRRKEREEYYRNETYQKMLDGSAESAETVRRLIEEQEGRRELRRRQNQALGFKLGGWITIAAGLGVAVFLYFLIPDEPIWLAGVIALLVGPVLVFYGHGVESKLRDSSST